MKILFAELTLQSSIQMTFLCAQGKSHLIVNLIWHRGGYFDPKVSLLGVVALWGDCKFIPKDWGSVIAVDLCYVALLEDFSL